MIKNGEKWGKVGDGQMLMGEFSHSIDNKGRLFMPAKLRENLGTPFVVTKGVDGCVDVYPMEAWEKLKDSFAQKMMPKHRERDVSRFIFGGAAEVEPDKQGRILLPPNLRKHAKIQDSVIIVGVGSKAEIWDAQRYEDYMKAEEEDVAQMVEELDFD